MSVLYGSRTQALRDLFADDVESRPPTGIPEWDMLPPIWSGGLADSPEFALVFINPTYRNQSTPWEAEFRAPHIGPGSVRMWKFFSSCQLLPEYVPETLSTVESWFPSTAAGIYYLAAESGLYVTNLVKACRTTSAMPSMALAQSYRQLLAAELHIVRPRVIIAMGQMVSRVLTGKTYRMRDLHDTLADTGRVTQVNTLLGTVVPCYFPAGRGEPAKAREIISAAVKGIAREKAGLI